MFSLSFFNKKHFHYYFLCFYFLLVLFSYFFQNILTAACYFYYLRKFFYFFHSFLGLFLFLVSTSGINGWFLSCIQFLYNLFEIYVQKLLFYIFVNFFYTLPWYYVFEKLSIYFFRLSQIIDLKLQLLLILLYVYLYFWVNLSPNY